MQYVLFKTRKICTQEDGMSVKILETGAPLITRIILFNDKAAGNGGSHKITSLVVSSASSSSSNTTKNENALSLLPAKCPGFSTREEYHAPLYGC
jgi:hypothetical protein